MSQRDENGPGSCSSWHGRVRGGSKVSWEGADLVVLCSPGSWPAWQTGARVACEPCSPRCRAGPAASPAVEGGAHSEHGPCGPRDHHGGAADLQAEEEAGKRLWSGGERASSFLRATLLPVLAHAYPQRGSGSASATRMVCVRAPCLDMGQMLLCQLVVARLGTFGNLACGLFCMSDYLKGGEKICPW